MPSAYDFVLYLPGRSRPNHLNSVGVKNQMALTSKELARKAALAVRKINAENDIKLRKVMTVLGRYGSIADAVIYRDNDWNEYRVLQFVNGEHVVNADYHTDDYEDAQSTALVMANPKFESV